MMKKILLMALLLGISKAGKTDRPYGIAVLFPEIEISYVYSSKCPINKPFINYMTRCDRIKYPCGHAISLPPLLDNKNSLENKKEDDENCKKENEILKKEENECFNKYCISCAYEKDILIEEGYEKNFDICSNRKTIQKNGHFYSILKKENK